MPVSLYESCEIARKSVAISVGRGRACSTRPVSGPPSTAATPSTLAWPVAGEDHLIAEIIIAISKLLAPGITSTSSSAAWPVFGYEGGWREVPGRLYEEEKVIAKQLGDGMIRGGDQR